jgi:hypothetical protein
MFEAGIAAGIQRPILIVASPEGSNQLPVDLIPAPIIRHQLGSRDLLKDSLKAYLGFVYPIAARLIINWDDLVDEEHSQSAESKIPREDSLIRRIALHLDQVGALVAVDSRIPGGRVDITATFPALGDSFNPVLIEVKPRVRNAESALQQMRQYLRATRARLGLVVDGTSSFLASRTYVESSTGIIILSHDELMSWDGNRIVREITRLRNQVVHSA